MTLFFVLIAARLDLLMGIGFIVNEAVSIIEIRRIDGASVARVC